MKTLTAWLGTAGLLVAAGFAFVTFGMPLLTGLLSKPEQPVNVSVPATQAPEVKKAPRKAITIAAPVQVVAGKKPKEDLKLPDAVVKDENKEVLAATQVKGSDRPQTITTVVDEKTGEIQTFTKLDPYPWLAVERKAEVRMAYGYRFTPNGSLPSLGSVGNSVKQVGRLSFNYEALRVKALTLGATAQVDTDGQSFVGVGVAYRW